MNALMEDTFTMACPRSRTAESSGLRLLHLDALCLIISKDACLMPKAYPLMLTPRAKSQSAASMQGLIWNNKCILNVLEKTQYRCLQQHDVMVKKSTAPECKLVDVWLQAKAGSKDVWYYMPNLPASVAVVASPKTNFAALFTHMSSLPPQLAAFATRFFT